MDCTCVLWNTNCVFSKDNYEKGSFFSLLQKDTSAAAPFPLHPADPTQQTTGREMKFPSLCVCKPASFPGQKTEQAAINYKEILSSCGRFATTLVSKANRYGVLGSLVPCTAAIPNPGPQILLLQIRESEGGGELCYLHTAAS